MQKNKPLFSIQTITFTALLTALQIVLGNLLQIPLLGKQYNLGLLPIAAAGALMGPVPAAIVGGLGDFIGAHLFPAGAYFPGFTLTNVLVGLICGLGLHRRWPSIARSGVTMAAALLVNLLLNSYWLSHLAYVPGRSYAMWLSVRAVNYPIELIVNVTLVYLMLLMLTRAAPMLPSGMRLIRKKEN